MLAIIAKTPPGHDQGRGGRDAAARGNQSRADLRILPDHLRHQHEPRALRPEMGEGRHHVDRLRRQLSRLYRRHLPHGDPGRAGRRAQRFARRDREHPARGLQGDAAGRAWAREIYAAAEPLVAKSKHHNQSSNSSRTAWAWSATRRRGSPTAGRCLIRPTDADIPLEAGDGGVGGDHAQHPSRGFIKLEDTVVVTDTGHEVYGEGARGWNRAGRSGISAPLVAARHQVRP